MNETFMMISVWWITVTVVLWIIGIKWDSIVAGLFGGVSTVILFIFLLIGGVAETWDTELNKVNINIIKTDIGFVSQLPSGGVVNNNDYEFVTTHEVEDVQVVQRVGRSGFGCVTTVKYIIIERNGE